MNKVATKRTIDFTDGPVFGKMLRFALPIMATALLQTLYNASDMIVVGQFSPNGAFSMGAVGACGSLISLCINFFIGLSSGVGVCVAQALGAGRHDEVRKYTHTSAVISLICGIALGIFGFFFARPLLTLMGTPENLLVEAVPYMQAYFVGAPAMLVYNFLASSLRSVGDSKRPLIFLTISGFINVIVNFIMVVFFGMGAVGVGIATTVAQYVSAIMIVSYMMRTDGVSSLNVKELRIDKTMVRGIMQNGVPVGVQSIVFSLSNVLIQSTINTYGDIVVTGNSTAANLESFIYVAMNSVAIATTTVVGQNVGAGKVERIKRILPISLALVSFIGITFGILVNVFGEQLLSIYESGHDAISQAIRDAGKVRLLFISIPYFLCGCMDCISYSLKGMGRAAISMIVCILGSCVVRIIWISTVCPLFPQQIGALYIVYPVSYVITISGLTFFLIKAYKQMTAPRGVRV